jgi:light-regulated signal transduction histidine kinase (bacteriophytochrome)
MRIAMENLLSNSWKFTSKTPDACIKFGVTRRDNERVYFLTDNGAGFDMAYADRLFTPFKRLHSDAEFSGTGIGLAIVRRIIGRHGGKVWAEGKPGEGATFFFTLNPGQEES